MTALILGPNNSGKSGYAEKLAVWLSTGALYYVATMIPYGEEGLERVKKHLRQRDGMGFVTVEKPVRVAGIPVLPDATVLLEDVSNLLGNTLEDRGAADAFDDIAALCAKCSDCVLVSIGGLVAKPGYDRKTKRYIDNLNELNKRLYGLSDTVVVMRDKTPDFIKGDAIEMD